MSRTKIVCTIGPACRSRDTIAAMMRAGMNVARLNFSHGTHEEHRMTIHAIREVSLKLDQPVAILQDLSGPKIRLGQFEGGSAHLEDDSSFVLTTRDVPGNEREVRVDHKALLQGLKKGDVLLLGDGIVELEVAGVKGSDVQCRVVAGGLLGSNKGINLPMNSGNLPSLTEKDRCDLLFGLEYDVDYMAVSFVRTAEDVREAQKLIHSHGRKVPVIAKIEKSEAICHLDGIIEVADGLMVARGDLGIEIPLEQVPTVQKKIIAKANEAAKPVITATQMLGSMVRHPRPTRAEVTDVANAVLDGTDAIMLSEETAVGEFPVNTVQVMRRICDEAEAQFPHERWRRQCQSGEGSSVPEAISYSACEMAGNLAASAIVVFTGKGFTARMVSRHRPRANILSVTAKASSYRQLSLVWGVEPVLIGPGRNPGEAVELATRVARNSGIVGKGERFIITGGLPIGVTHSTNSVTVATMG